MGQAYQDGLPVSRLESAERMPTARTSALHQFELFPSTGKVDATRIARRVKLKWIIMSTPTLLNTLRCAFFLGSVGALFTALRWDDLKPHVRKLDTILVKAHMHGSKVALGAAMAKLKEGKQKKGLQDLMELAKDLRHVRLGTRLEETRTIVLDTLGERLLAANRNEEAMTWTEELLLFNPRDFPAILRRAELHRRAGNDDLELVDIQAAFKVGAASGPAILPFVDAMVRRGRREELAVALLQLGDVGPTTLPAQGWEFRWSNGADTKYAAKALLTPKRDRASGLLRGQIPPRLSQPATMYRVRVDLPGGTFAELRDMKVELVTVDGSITTLDLTHVIHAHHLTPIEGGGYFATGKIDPFIVLESPEASPLVNVQRAAVTLDITPLLPVSARELFADGLTDAEREAWTEQFGEDMVSTLEASLGH